MKVRIIALAALLAGPWNALAGEYSLDLTEGWLFWPGPAVDGAASDLAEDDWVPLHAGVRWEDQGFPDLDGRAWYRIHIDVPEAWQGRCVWFYAGAVNDACTLYCNGERIAAFGEDGETGVARIPILADLSSAVRCGATNVIALDVNDWGGSGGLWKLPCMLASDLAELPMDSFLSTYMDPETKVLSVLLNAQGLGERAQEARLEAEVRRAGVSTRKAAVNLSAGQFAAAVDLPLPDMAPGQSFSLRMVLADASGAPWAGLDWTQRLEWPQIPQWPEPYAGLKVRNNFVTELASVDLSLSEAHTFPNPRDGWVFFQAPALDIPPKASLNEETASLVWRENPDTGQWEAMRKLSEGNHTLHVLESASGVLEIRTMPELAYCYFPATPHITPYGPYDWGYVRRHVLPHVNTLVTTSDSAPSEYPEWGKEGRQWIGNASLPGLTSDTAPPADEVYAIWAGMPGAHAPGYAGIIVDEFLWNSPAHYRAWTEAFRRLHQSPAFASRTFWAWCGDIHGHEPASEFRGLLPELGHRFAWERYLPEAPTRAEARCLLVQELRTPYLEWQTLQPGIAQSLTVCLGYLCAPPESLNRDPNVDYHVFLDTQFQMLATDPAFWNLSGLMEYSASYADEESLRYAHRLFRHYAIEGHRQPLSGAPYRLDHLSNPDFARGLEGWTVEAAEPGAVDTRTMDGYSFLQGRYPRTPQGDHFCWMKRSESAANRVRQTLRGLQPGQLYSLKLIAADLGQLDVPQTVSLNVQMAGADILGEFGLEHTYPSNYAHTVEPYNREHPAYFTLRRVVFRPAADTAGLTISDWGEDGAALGPAGRESTFNFIEVQPFLAP